MLGIGWLKPGGFTFADQATGLSATFDPRCDGVSNSTVTVRPVLTAGCIAFLRGCTTTHASNQGVGHFQKISIGQGSTRGCSLAPWVMPSEISSAHANASRTIDSGSPL